MRSLPESTRYHERAIEIRQQLVERFPDNRLYKRSLASAINNLANRKSDAGLAAEAIALHESFMKLMNELLAVEPQSIELRAAIAKGHNFLGDYYRGYHQLPDRFDRALPPYLQSLAMQKRLINENPGAMPLKKDLANTLHNLTTVHVHRKEYDEAMSRCQEYLGLLEEMQGQEPQSVDRYSVAIGMHSKSRILEAQGRHEEAIGEYQRCIEEFHGIVEQSPKLYPVRESLKHCLRELAPLLRSAGRYREAAEAAMERRSLAASQANELYNVALDLAQTTAAMSRRTQGAANSAPAVDRLASSVPDEEIGNVASMALDVLDEAIDAGWKDFTRLQADTAFTVVWQHAGDRERSAELRSLLKSCGN
jgi:tetratricopeptide (TPR) repeat protein